MSLPERIFLGWEQPLAEAVADRLLAAVPRQDGIWDLGAQLVLVPSAFASRMVQEALARKAGALLLPQITTPSHFLSGAGFQNGDPELAEPEEVAGREAMALAWVAVLTDPGFNRADYPALFQQDRPGPMTPAGALAFAQDLLQLQDELGVAAEGLGFAETARHAAWKRPELQAAAGQVARWEQLARLEERYLGKLAALGLVDHNRHRRQVALSSDLPAGIEAVWLAGVIDLPPLLETALTVRGTRTAVRVLIAAEPGDAGAFDAWGRPDAAAWAQPRGSPWPDFAGTVHVVQKPEDGLECLGRLVRQHHTRVRGDGGSTLEAVGRLAVVPCDREAYPALITRELHALARGPGGEPLLNTANPLGRRHQDHGIHHAMAALLDLADEPTFGNLRRCVNHPVVAGRLRLTELEQAEAPGGGRKPIGWHHLQRLLDAVSAATAPQPLDETLAFARSVRVDGGVEPRQRVQNQRIREAATAVEAGLQAAVELRALGWRQLGERALALAQPGRGAGLAEDEWLFAADVSEAIEAALGGLQPGRPEATALTARDVVRLALRAAGARSFRGDIDREAVNLPGWLEIPWEPVPHLVLFGLTDDLVPGVRHAHPFLPATLRAALGLGSPAQQFAQAACALELVRRQRAQGGRVDVIVPRHNDQGDGLRPSRLLMLSPERGGDTLLGTAGCPGRLDHLLREVRAARAEPIWDIPPEHRLDATLRLPADPAKADVKRQRLRGSISATAFKTYLENPADFWLKHALGMSETSHDAIELDAAGFGTLLHAAVEAFGRDPETRDLTDRETIFRALEAKLEGHFRERFGRAPAGSLLLQRETARVRLRAFAGAQAQLRDEGWSMLEVEGSLPEIPIAEGFTLRGRFDRLDVHRDGRRFRVYDYKSFAKAKPPERTHLAKSKASGELGYFELPSTAKSGKGAPQGWRWKDLQLPAYDWALTAGRPEVGQGSLEVGYLCLSGEANPEVVRVWTGFAGTFRTAARACMREIAGLLARGGPESFQPAAQAATYPVLEHLAGRRPEVVLNLATLGATEPSRG
jgi:ATP-dependent helicase/nuclease subunit B